MRFFETKDYDSFAFMEGNRPIVRSNVNRFKEIIKKQIENHATTFLISSHDLNHVTEVCERIVLLEKGLPIKDLATDSKTFNELEAYFKA